MEFGGADGFAEVVVHAGGSAGLAVADEGVGGEGDDVGGGAGGGMGAEVAGGFEAVHLGHLDVHEDDVVGLALDGGEDLEAVGGEVGAVAEAGEHVEGDLLVHDVIFGEEDVFGVSLWGWLEWERVRGGGGRGCGEAEEGFEEEGRFGGFIEHGAEAGAILGWELLADGAEEEAGKFAGGGEVVESVSEHDAVHAGHLHVEDGEVESLALVDEVEGGLAVGDGGGVECPLGGEVGEDAAVGGVVVHHEGAEAVQGGGRARGEDAAGGGGDPFGVEGEVESGAFARGALEPHAAVH